MDYNETKQILEQYSIEDLRDLRKMIDESISTKSENEYKNLVKEFSDKHKVGDCFVRKYRDANALSIDFVTNISVDKVETIRYDIEFDNNDICIYDDELILFHIDEFKKSNIKESDMKKICDNVDSSVENIYKAAIFDIFNLIKANR